VASVTVRRGDLYDVLGVAPDASSDEIATAFRVHAKQFHPDRNPGDSAAAERFKDLTLAYQTLIRPGRRADYDRRHHPAAAPPTPPARSGHDPIFRTPGRARAAVVSGAALFVLGVAAAVLLCVLDTGGTGETVTLWIAAVKLLVCGPILSVVGAVRLRRLATDE